MLINHYISLVKLLVVLSFILISISAIAQIQEGVWTIGGAAKLSGTVTPNMHYSSIGLDFTTSTGYFYKDNRMFGILAGISLRKYNYAGNSTYPRYDIGALIGPELRQYKSMGNGLFGFFADESITGQILNTYGPNKISTRRYYGTLSIKPGFYFFMVNRLSFEFTFADLYYAYSKNPRTNISYGFAMDLSTLRIGLRYYFQQDLQKSKSLKKP